MTFDSITQIIKITLIIGYSPIPIFITVLRCFNMQKILFQVFVIVSLCFALWFALSKVDWVSLFKLDQVADTTEKAMGTIFWDLYSKSALEITSEAAIRPLDSIVTKICISNGIDKSQITLHLIKSDEINAFALPNRHLVINTGLIATSDHEAELCGVIGHEIAHMELNHVMKKLIKEVGLSALISMTTGGGAEQIKEIARMLSSSAYDRNLEKEADIKAVEYLKNANINPAFFADFLYRLGESEPTNSQYFSWISTHPDSKERAAYIIASIGQQNTNFSPVLSTDAWDQLKGFATN